VRAAIKRIVLLVVGWGFVLLGIVGLFLPVLQGILFILIGLIILSSEYVWAHHLLEKLKNRFPGVGRKSHHASAWAKSWMSRLGRRSSTSSGQSQSK
jgi:uncharacterized membrane protein YbaN (DUF454 family)